VTTISPFAIGNLLIGIHVQDDIFVEPDLFKRRNIPFADPNPDFLTSPNLKMILGALSILGG